MISVSAAEKARKLDEILFHLQEKGEASDWQLLSSFARVVFGSLPGWMAQGLDSSNLADRVWDNYHFFVKELPPPTQLYRGLPGLHVVVRSSVADESLHTVRGKTIPMDTTIVETHTPDAPFIFGSLKNYFRKAGLRVFSAIHPILAVRRQWERVVWIGDAHDEGDKELLCRFRIEYIESKDRLRRVQHEIFCVLKCLFLALEDFDEMTNTVKAVTPRLSSTNTADLEAARSFLQWLADENYIFMGIASYRMGPDGAPNRLPDSSLGAFRDPALLPVVFPGLLEEVERHLVPTDDDKRVIDIDYCSNASAIYHLEPIDDIVIRHFDDEGNLKQETLLLGRFSQGSFSQRAADVPLLREKQRWLIEHSGDAPMSFAFRQVRALFNRFPRRELFYAPVEALKPFMDRIVQMTGDDEMAIHHRLGPGYAAIYVAFARIRYSYQFEKDMRRALTEKFGPVTFTASQDASGAQVLIFYLDLERLKHPIDEDDVRQLAESLITTWSDSVSSALTSHFGEREGRRLFLRWVTSQTRSGIYRESTSPEEVPFDLEHLEVLEARLALDVVRRGPEHATLKIYSPKLLGFIDTLTTLRNLGLGVTGELHIPIQLPDGHRANMYRYEIEDSAARIAALEEGKERIAEAIRAVDEERGSDGPLNRLIVTAGLTWREVEVLRTFRNLLQQLRPHYNVETVNGVILQNARVATALFRGFEARFDPELDSGRDERERRVLEELENALGAVRSLVNDEVLRALANVIGATVRTNFYQSPERPVVSVKIESARVESMPSPRPLFEIYVHSPRLEGVHLRGGRVARGGIRWSDRHDDFRTEILGLMKTQTLKNSIIIPVGSKGGFVLKGELPPRPALDAHLAERYREFISGLLDVTDNMVDGEVLHPPEVMRHDEDDPYLVVAADKGTAHLSDTANAVAKHYGFWLGDAFASGGSVGYDHKKVGITARGAWECIKHHFRNIGIDVTKDPFTVVGIGDMGGDVFGNGMLRSRSTRLVAAFNHVHIFIDPNPDPEASFAERKRLFGLPRSSWLDYDASTISRGGGVYERSAKSVPVTPEARALFDIQESKVSGEEMIRRMLKAKVDLLYNGGIGTYVKASSEDDVDVGDRANDRLRVDADKLRARIIGEGGNLGLTQKARLEYWAGGGLINTDAVDNSGGVDMSDHEVNLKILMDMLVKKGALENREERNRILLEMTEDVATLVLADNDAQALALTLDGMRSQARYDELVALVYELITSGIMSRADDDVPSRKELLESPHRERGLPRPLLALVLGHVKIWAFRKLLETDFPNSGEATLFLENYFPARLREAFAESFVEHPLKREIIATAAVNYLVNHAGVDFISRLTKSTGAGIGGLMRAYVRCAQHAKAEEVREAILSSDREVSEKHQTLLELEDALESSTRAALDGSGSDPAEAVAGVRKSFGLQSRDVSEA